MFLDLTVVYFAFGAPLGMYEIARNRRSPKAVALAAVHFVLWPFFAIASLRSLAGQPEQSLERRIDELRTEFETEAFNTESGREFRDVYARYTGLALALRAGNGGGSSELFDIAGHHDGRLASKCFDRRNRRRLEFHQLQARNEFDEMVSKLADPRVDQLALKLDDLLEAH